MKLEIIVQGEATAANLGDGVITVGGGATDGIQIPNLKEACAQLRIDGGRLMVRATDTFMVDEVLSPGGVERLVLAGERIALADGVQLRWCEDDARPPERGTAAVLKHLLTDFEDPGEVRCASLTCLTGLDVGRRYPMAGDIADVGRGDGVHMRIRDRAVSRMHARLRRTATGFTVEDLDSPNGVFVNGKKIRGATALVDGAVLELGHSLLRFRAPKEEPAAAPPAPTEEAPAAQPGAAEEAAASAVAQPAPKARRSRMEVGLIGLGVALALVGVVVSFGIASGPQSPAAAISAPSPAPPAR